MRGPLAAMNDSPTIAVIGGGAIGGYYGARLAQHGHDVHFLLRSDYDAVRRDGWRIRSYAGDFCLAPDASHICNDPRQMPPADLVLVAIKTTANDQYESLIAPLLKHDTAIVSLQNGLGNDERLAELFGAPRVVGGMAFVCSNRLAPGVIHHIAYGRISVGEFGSPPGQRVARIADLFTSSGIPAEVLADLRQGRWKKLVWNVPFNGLGAVLDQSTDRLISDDGGVQIVSALMKEIIVAAESLGLAMPPDMAGRMLRHTRTMGAYRTSMQIDRQGGRPMEIESILGEPLRQARRQGVQTPRLEMLYEMARMLDNHGVEREIRPIQ